MSAGDPKGMACEEIAALIPWYVNGTIDPDGRQRVTTHVLACPDCRNELEEDRRLFRCMNVEAAVEIMPTASLKRLYARLDANDTVQPSTVPAAGPVAELQLGGFERRDRITAILAVAAAVVSLVAADRWMQSGALVSEPRYHTVTSSKPRVPNAIIRAVFTPTTTIGEMQSIVGDAGLRIVSGPSEAGVYSLSTDLQQPVSSSLGKLRGNAKVRFAESIQADSDLGDTP